MYNESAIFSMLNGRAFRFTILGNFHIGSELVLCKKDGRARSSWLFTFWGRGQSPTNRWHLLSATVVVDGWLLVVVITEGLRLAVVAAVHVAARVFLHVAVGGIGLSLIAAVAGITVDSWV